MSDHPSLDDDRCGLHAPLSCEEWECRLADLLDGNLRAPGSVTFDEHSRTCATCAATLQQAREGIAWLEFLEEPEVRAGLLPEILARTGGADTGAAPIAPPRASEQPAWRRIVLPAAHQAVETRLIMTAAMMFFSIALILNLAGIRLSAVHLSDLRPSMLREGLSRQYYAADEQVVKYYENLRFVSEVEARVRELRQSSEPESSPEPSKISPPSRDGSADRTAPGFALPEVRRAASGTENKAFGHSSGTIRDRTKRSWA